MELTAKEGGITTVECPACHTDITVSLPRDAEVLSLTVAPEENPDHSENGASRPRDIEIPCSCGEQVTVFFDW